VELLYFTRPYLHCALRRTQFHSVVFQWAVYAACCIIGNIGAGRTEVATTFTANRRTILCATYARWDTHILRQTQFHTTYQPRMPKRTFLCFMPGDQKNF